MLAFHPSNYISSLYSHYSPEEKGSYSPARSTASEWQVNGGQRWPAGEVAGQGSYRRDTQGQEFLKNPYCALGKKAVSPRPSQHQCADDSSTKKAMPFLRFLPTPLPPRVLRSFKLNLYH